MSHRILRGSRVIRYLAHARERLGSAIAGSRLLSTLYRRFDRDGDRSTGETDRGGTGDSTASNVGTLREIASQSRLSTGLARVSRTLRVASGRSRLSDLAGGGRKYVEGSWLYRWLTAEPEPDVVVIDLRETLTVGPWLAAIERGLRWLLPATATSLLFGVAGRGHRLVAARPVQTASLLVGSAVVALLAVSVLTGGVSTPVAVITLVFGVLAILGSRLTLSVEELRETRGYRALANAFEPPEPPARTEDEQGENGTTDNGVR